jgi:hypothetical protein
MVWKKWHRKSFEWRSDLWTMKLQNNLFIITKVTYFLIHLMNRNFKKTHYQPVILENNRSTCIPFDVLSFFEDLSIVWRKLLKIRDKFISNVCWFIYISIAMNDGVSILSLFTCIWIVSHDLEWSMMKSRKRKAHAQECHT